MNFLIIFLHYKLIFPYYIYSKMHNFVVAIA